MGKAALSHFWPNSYLSLIGPLINRFCRAESRVVRIDIDPTKDGPLSAMKKQCAKDGGVPFVSMNDVLVSTFANAASCAYSGMSVNLRR